jgi:hypothetical protein
VVVFPNQTTNQNFDLFPALADEDVRVVLTWDSHSTFGTPPQPNDMNLHLWIDDGQGNVREIQIGDMGYCADIELEPQACYEKNVQYGSGPDVLVFKAMEKIYSIAALNYYDDRPGFPDFDNMTQRGTPARVQVYKGGTLLFDKVVTNASGDGSKDLWYILKYDDEPIEQNCMITYTGAPPPDDCVAKMMKK